MEVDAALTSEQLDSLERQIVELSLRIDIAKHAMLTHLRDFDAHEGWGGTGFLSTSHWLAWRIGISPTAAREHVRVARALGELKYVDAEFAAGTLSYSKVRALTRVATPETEQGLVDIAMHTTAAQLEKLAAAYRRTRVDPKQPNLDLRRFARRSDVEVGESGEILDVGRARRTIPSAIGRALWLRDGGCRVPGCGRKRHLHAHHIDGWAEGGKTAQSNLVLLCPSHHTLVHEGQMSIEVCDGKLEFRSATGLKLEPVPDRGVDLEVLDHWLRTAEGGLEDDRYPLWDGSPLDLDMVLSWIYRETAASAGLQ